MTRSNHVVVSLFSGVFLFASVNLGSAQAMPRAISQLPNIPITLSAVFCGAGGCVPVTRVKRCAPDTVNQGLPAQRAITVHRTCNFL